MRSEYHATRSAKKAYNVRIIEPLLVHHGSNTLFLRVYKGVKGQAIRAEFDMKAAQNEVM